MKAPIVSSRFSPLQPMPPGYVYARRGIPIRPRMCIGKNVSAVPAKASQKLTTPMPSWYIRPVTFGNQK